MSDSNKYKNKQSANNAHHMLSQLLVKAYADLNQAYTDLDSMVCISRAQDDRIKQLHHSLKETEYALEMVTTDLEKLRDNQKRVGEEQPNA